MLERMLLGLETRRSEPPRARLPHQLLHSFQPALRLILYSLSCIQQGHPTKCRPANETSSTTTTAAAKCTLTRAVVRFDERDDSLLLLRYDYLSFKNFVNRISTSLFCNEDIIEPLYPCERELVLHIPAVNIRLFSLLCSASILLSKECRSVLLCFGNSFVNRCTFVFIFDFMICADHVLQKDHEIIACIAVAFLARDCSLGIPDNLTNQLPVVLSENIL